MPPATRAAAATVELRRELLSHARNLLETSGADAITMRALGKMTGRSAQAVYTGFGGRPALLTALAVSGHTELAQQLTACPATRSPTTDLFVQLIKYLAWTREHPHLYLLMTVPDPMSAIRADDRIRLTYGPVIEVLHLSVQRLIDTGAITSPDPRYVTSQLIAAIHGAALLDLEYTARGQDHANGDTGLELIANVLVALGSKRSTTIRSLLRAQSQ